VASTLDDRGITHTHIITVIMLNAQDVTHSRMTRAGPMRNSRREASHSPQQTMGPGLSGSSGGLRDARSTWIARRIKDAIGEAVQSQISVDSFIDSNPVVKRLEEFFAASGPPRIMFFFQQVPTPLGDLESEPEMKLLLSDGLDLQLHGKCMYFIRRSHGVDPHTKTPHLDMSYGEVNADILLTFHLTLHSAFLPLLEGGLQDWGKNTDANTKDYLATVTRFDEMIADAVSSLQVIPSLPWVDLMCKCGPLCLLMHC